MKILIADDHKIVREGLKNLIEKKIPQAQIHEAKNGLEALNQTQETFFNFIIMDISMPEMNGIEATKKILKLHPETKIITLSMHSDKAYIHESLQAGAKGFLLKDCAFEELLIALKTIHEGRLYLSPQISDVIVKDFITHPHETNSTPLSSREKEVLQLIAEGNSTKEIAGKLSVSVKTIENHRQQIMEKLDLHSIAELTKYAIREGLSSL